MKNLLPASSLNRRTLPNREFRGKFDEKSSNIIVGDWCNCIDCLAEPIPSGKRASCRGYYRRAGRRNPARCCRCTTALLCPCACLRHSAPKLLLDPGPAHVGRLSGRMDTSSNSSLRLGVLPLQVASATGRTSEWQPSNRTLACSPAAVHAQRVAMLPPRRKGT
jgi:hypothetical protein